MTEHGTREIFDLFSPFYVSWELTRRCTARCIHCPTDAEPDGGLNVDISLREALSIVDELVEAGVMVLTLSGGEALLHRHWDEIVGSAVTRGLRVNVTTNGALVDERTARRLKALGVAAVTVGLLSHEPARHDYIRQTEGSHAQALAAIERLVRHGVLTLVNYIPMRLNQHDAGAVIDLAHRLGVTAAILSEYIPAGRGSLDMALSAAELRDVLAEWRLRTESLRGRIRILGQDCRSRCGAGRYVARIMADGTVTPCMSLPVSVGNIRRGGFAELWARSPLLRRLRHRNDDATGDCRACTRPENCGGCRTVAYADWDGDPLAGDGPCGADPEPSP